VHDQPVVETTGHHQYVWLAIAASLVLAVGTALMLLVPQFSSRQNGTEAVSGNAAASATVQSGVEDLMKAEQLLQSGIAKLEQGIGNDGEGLPPEVTATLKTNLKILDQAIAESTDAVQKEPNNLAARNSLFDALQRKIALLQDTITLMNEMRKGNAAGVAHVVEGTKKS
jgi:hypothetical protein